MPSDARTELWIKIGLGAAIVFLLLRIFPALWGGLLPGLLIYILISWLMGRSSAPKSPPRSDDQLTRAIEEKIVECERKATEFRKQAETIKQQETELRDRLQRASEAGEPDRERAEKLLLDFGEEIRLRLAKAIFFQNSTQRLQQMLENRRLQRQLEKSEKQLEDWQSKNPLEVADLESMRERIRLDEAHLETIESLGQRVYASPDLTTTQQLTEEVLELGK